MVKESGKETGIISTLSGTQRLGSMAFLAGTIIAIIAGIWPLNKITTTVLVVLGVAVGFLNITAKETLPYLFTTLVLVFISKNGGEVIGTVEMVGPALQNILKGIIIFTIPAAVIVALKAIYTFAAEE